MAVRFFEHEVSAGLKQKRKLSAFIVQQVKAELPELKTVDLSYIFCNDEYLLTINQQYLDHDTYTDIITFDLSDKAGALKGELYISIARITENAAQFGVSVTDELHRVMFHGALHLCGFKDKTPEDEAAMRQQENKWLEQYKNGNQ